MDATKPDPTEVLNLAVGALNSGNFAQAEQYCRQIVGATPDSFDALHLLALVQSLQGKGEEAITNFDRALALQPDYAEALSNRGNTLHGMRRYQEALASFDRAIAARPDFAEAVSNRGVTLHELNRLDEALACFDRALKLQPNFPKALSNRGNTLHGLKRYDEALAAFDVVLKLAPDHVEALSNRGVTLHTLRRYDEALASYDRALSVRPNYAEALANRGLTLHELGRFAEAMASYERALQIRPGYPEALFFCGNALHELKRFDDALACFDHAVKLRPGYAEALSNRGLTLHAQKRFGDALVSFDQALALRPDYAEALSNRGVALRELRRFDEALDCYDRALALQPDFVRALSNRGNTLHALKRFDEALASFDEALALDPAYPEAHSNRGVVLHELMRFDEALTSFDRAIALRPDYADAHYNAALGCMLTGNFERGWKENEWRWGSEDARERRRELPKPLWLGAETIAGKTILVYGEQGFGDMIQFARYAPLFAERGARVILEIPEPLTALMRSLSGDVEIVTRGDPLPKFDLHSPLVSLPLAFDTRLETIPSATPYLHADPEAVRRWQARLGRHDGPRVGLVWSGRPAHKNDHNRSLRLEALLPLLAHNASFVSLQREVRPADAALLRARGDIRHFGEALTDFTETAALIANLDLVIAVDTSVAHLAGALAKPVWILLSYIPDWRWLLDRDDSPWYPTARLFRQGEDRAWDGVIRRLCDALPRFIEARSDYSEGGAVAQIAPFGYDPSDRRTLGIGFQK